MREKGKFRTSVKSRTLSPQWDEQFTLIVHDTRFQALTLVLYDSGEGEGLIVGCVCVCVYVCAHAWARGRRPGHACADALPPGHAAGRLLFTWSSPLERCPFVLSTAKLCPPTPFLSSRHAASGPGDWEGRGAAEHAGPGK